MLFLASKVLLGLVLPGNVLAVLLVFGCALLFMRAEAWRRWGRRLVVLVAVGFLGFAFVPVGSLITLPLEQRFPPPDPLPPRVDGIIMLGGAVNPAASDQRGQPVVNDAAERILAFADLGRRYPEARMVFSGGSGSMWGDAYREGEATRAALDETGLDTGRVIFENESRNTWENAIFSKPFADPRPGETWLLVTSAWHMPRSVGIFREIGWPVVPYPVDYRTRPGARPLLIFDLGWSLDSTTLGLKEWIGLVAYYLMGRTSALFPAP